MVFLIYSFLTMYICENSIAQNFDSTPKINYTKLVDTRIGSEGSGLSCGYTYIGASYPFGMIQFTPSFFSPQKGIVVNQMSGSGCPHMGNFPVLPIGGEITKSPKDMDSFPRYKTIKEAIAGYCSIQMQDETICDITTSKRSGIIRFTFPANEKKGTVLIGAGVSSTELSNAFIRITSLSSCEGYAEGGDFCGYKTDYRIFFVAEFNRNAKEFGTWKGDNLKEGRSQIGGIQSGGYFTFDTEHNQNIEYKIAISYVSIENARENLRADNNGRNYQQVLTDTQNEWNRQLGKIEVQSENRDKLTQFYTHWYHALIHPNIFNDVNREYIGADFTIHKTEQGRECYTTFSGWDTYRTQCQLLAMFYPKESSDMMQSAVNFAEQSGGYGRWIATNIETGVMHGDPMPIIIANTYAFGGRDFNIETAYKYMKHAACIPGVYSQNVEVRPKLSNYINKGIENASLCLEYTSSDYAIGQFALQAIKNEQDAFFFMKRSLNWKNLYDPSTNWLRSRNTQDLSWKNPNADWREATKENYFWMVPYDLKTLIDTIGGKKIASKRLDSLFVRLDAGYDDHYFAAGNEPDFQVPWIYNWTDRPYKTSETVHRILNEMYTSKPNGLPGNDDCGSMGAWYVFASMGLYPMIPGIAGFSISAPYFEKIRLHLTKGTLTIEGGSISKPYICSVKVNGVHMKRTWIDWSKIENGGAITYKTSDRINKKWGL
jgi:alpha-1,2-mannosidase, putative